VVGAAALWSLPSYAHHSFAAYDQKVTQMVSGTLKEFDWDAPHAGMTVAYLDGQGAMQEVSVTTGSPAVITKQGFKPNDFRIGSKVTMSWHPNRNGAPGGELVELKLDDGRVLHGGFPSIPGGKPGEPPPAAGAPSGPEKSPATGY
jgi:hypothetical protein